MEKFFKPMFVVVFLLASFAALADDAPPPPSQDEQALADYIAEHIQEELEGEPYSVTQSCDGDDCVITLTRE